MKEVRSGLAPILDGMNQMYFCKGATADDPERVHALLQEHAFQMQEALAALRVPKHHTVYFAPFNLSVVIDAEAVHYLFSQTGAAAGSHCIFYHELSEAGKVDPQVMRQHAEEELGWSIVKVLTLPKRLIGLSSDARATELADLAAHEARIVHERAHTGDTRSLAGGTPSVLVDRSTIQYQQVSVSGDMHGDVIQSAGADSAEVDWPQLSAAIETLLSRIPEPDVTDPLEARLLVKLREIAAEARRPSPGLQQRAVELLTNSWSAAKMLAETHNVFASLTQIARLLGLRT